MSRSSEELAIAYQQGEPDALALLWVQVEKLARRMVSRYASLAKENGAVDFEDLLQSAFLGVERAARAFNPEAVAFAAIMRLYVKKECAAALGLRGRVRLEHYYSQSTDQLLPGSEDMTLLDTIPDADPVDEDEQLFQDDIQRELEAAIQRLGDKQGTVIRSCFVEGMSCGAIGAHMGINTAKVYALRGDAIRRLRRDQNLQRLAKETLCWRCKGLRAFNTTWSSVVEDCVIRWDERRRMGR